MAHWNNPVWSGAADPSPVPAIRFRQVTGLRPTYLWLGDSATDQVQQTTLLQQGAASLGNTVLGGNPDSSLVTGAYRFTAASVDAWRAQDPKVADLSTGSAIHVAVVRLSVVPGVGIQNFAGKRDGAANPGYETGINVNGQALVVADVGASSATRILTNNLADDMWHTIAWSVDRSTAMLRLATESEPGSTVAMPAGSLASTSLFAIGAQRNQAAAFDCMLYATIETGTEGVDPGDVSGTLAAEMFLTPQLVWRPN